MGHNLLITTSNIHIEKKYLSLVGDSYVIMIIVRITSARAPVQFYGHVLLW